MTQVKKDGSKPQGRSAANGSQPLTPVEKTCVRVRSDHSEKDFGEFEPDM